MQIFCDESYRRYGRHSNPHATLAAIAIPINTLRGISREIFNLKRHYFPDIIEETDFEIKGNLLLSRRSFKADIKTNEMELREKYRFFSNDIIDLCCNYQLKVFSVTKKVISKEIDLLKIKPDLSLGEPYKIMLRAVNKYIEEFYPKNIATFVFDELQRGKDEKRSLCFTRYMYKTRTGMNYSKNISILPYFANSKVSEGSQIADLFAYIINEWHQGRLELEEYYQKIKSCEYKSVTTNLKGMVYKRK